MAGGESEGLMVKMLVLMGLGSVLWQLNSTIVLEGYVGFAV